MAIAGRAKVLLKAVRHCHAIIRGGGKRRLDATLCWCHIELHLQLLKPCTQFVDSRLGSIVRLNKLADLFVGRTVCKLCMKQLKLGVVYFSVLLPPILVVLLKLDQGHIHVKEQQTI